MKKILKYILIIIIILVLIVLSIRYINYLKIKNAKIDVKLVDNMVLEFNDKKKVSDYIQKINGKIIDDYVIDSTKLGDKKIDFKFINDDNIKVKYSYNLKVVDTVPPVIWLNDTYSVIKGSEDNLLDNIMCGDNYDSNPKCEIIGDYDLNSTGSYSLLFKATDSSNNIKEQPFTLNVREKSKSYSSKKSYTKFSDVVNKYKNDKTKIGIDVSAWQGDIDLKKAKDAGVEFIIIKVGGTLGTNKDYYLDSKFKQNIESANELGIDVGIYFYSYAANSKQAINDAKWLLKQIKGYEVSLPIAFDWEDFSDFNSYNISFYELTNMANSFIKTVEKAGYKGMLYGSRNYLEKIWLPVEHDIWLAHYTDETDYEGKYKIWQKCDNGLINGINGPVDIDIMYY